MMNDFKFTNVTLKPEQKYVAYCSLRYVQNMATFCFGAHGKNIPILNQIFAYLKVKNVNILVFCYYILVPHGLLENQMYIFVTL